jgi:hypothetical protein
MNSAKTASGYPASLTWTMDYFTVFNIVAIFQEE